MFEPPGTLAHRYRIDRPIGEGGMARVFLGTDLAIGRPVAVKVLRPALAAQASFVTRFGGEAQLAAGLVHPDIVAVYDHGSDDGVHFIVMEHVEGRTLATVLREGPLLPERVAEIGEAVAEALSFAHRAGVIHCDVKPANVMITRSGGVKVMDFGIALAATTLPPHRGLVLATAAYLSPERATGARPDERSDVYSLGVVLFELLTGRPPFVGDDPVAVARAHVRDQPPRPGRLNREVPRDLEAVVLRAMAKEPERRYASAGRLRMDLEACRAAMSTGLAQRVTPARRRRRRAERPRPLQRRSRLGMVLAEGAVALAVVALVVWAGRASDEASSFTGREEFPRRPAVTVSPSPIVTAPPITTSPTAEAPPASPSPSPSPSPSASPRDDGILPIPLPSIPPFP